MPNKKKTAHTKSAATSTGGRIDQFVEFQRRAVSRYVQIAANAAQRLSARDLDLSGWIADYSGLWSDVAGDLSDATKSLFPLPARRAAKSKAASDTEGATDAYRNWLALQHSWLSRAADCYRDVGQLVASGSTEPREWLDRYASFWSGVVSDAGDWARRESGEGLRPTLDWMPRYRREVKPGRPTAAMKIDVPLEAFPEDDSVDATVTLVTAGFTRVSGVDSSVTLDAQKYMKLVPSKVGPSQRSCELKLFNLPAGLRAGDVYAGVVWAVQADNTKVAIAAIELVVK